MTADLIVYGGTPAGIAGAVRGAREGLHVLLVSPQPRLGGALANGLSLWDTFYDGPRAPLFDEIKRKIQEYYRAKYGAESPQYRAALPGPRLKDHATGAFEPSVAQFVLEQLVAGEPNITVRRGAFIREVRQTDRRLTSVRVGDEWIAGRVFVDATYEGDLLALAGAKYRVGREGRDEFGEQFAGKLFARKKSAVKDGCNTSPRDAFEGRLNIRTWMQPTVAILPGSTGAADDKVQAYNYRLALSRNPANRRPVEKPAGYDRAQFAHLSTTMRVHPIGLINDTCGWNGGRPIGWNYDYPEADETKREQIRKRYRDFAVGALYFLQNDDSLDGAAREFNRQWGFAQDQFADNDNLPYEFYVREARRLVGRYVLRESDGLIAPGTGRAPVHEDAIAFTEWPMDSVQVLPETIPDAAGAPVIEGAFFLSEESRPGMVPYRSLLPAEFDNLIVPVCLSSTHVFWGAVRLEPVWIQTGELAGLAAALGLPEPDRLVREWVKRGAVVTFFNEEQTSPVAQYSGTRGFFHDYNARLHEPLKAATAKLWATGQCDPRAVAAAEQTTEILPTTRGEYLEELFS